MHVKISRIRTEDVSEGIAELAGKFKFEYAGGAKGLPLADAIIAATASVGRAIVISHEEHFKKIKEIDAQTPGEFLGLA